jgi:hypothetical protein
MTKLNMTKLSRLLYVCVGVAWVGAGLGVVGTGLAIWDGNKAASIFGAVGGVMGATTLTAAFGWFEWWKHRN